MEKMGKNEEGGRGKIRVSFAYGNGCRGERESNQEKGVDDRQAAMERAMGSSTIFTRC